MKLRATITVEYEPEPSYYPGAETAEEMAKIDHDNWQNNSIDLVSSFEESEMNVKVEVIEDG